MKDGKSQNLIVSYGERNGTKHDQKNIYPLRKPLHMYKRCIALQL
jgi:hypothetical protein